MTSHDRFIVLERPHGDQRHVEPGWWETFDLLGNKKGSRKLAGFYPDDLALSLDGKLLYVISSGQAEGDPKKPMPAIETFGLELTSGEGRTVSRVEFDPRDDPGHVSGFLSASGRCAAVLLAKTNQDRRFRSKRPRDLRAWSGRLKPSGAGGSPYVSAIGRFGLGDDAGGLSFRGNRHRVALGVCPATSRRDPSADPTP